MWFLPLILITIAITGLISYKIASEQVFSKVQQNQEDLLKKNIAQFLVIDQETDNFINYLFLSNSIQELLTSDQPSLLLQQTYSTLSKVMVTHPTIHSLIIYNYDYLGPTKPPLAINQTGTTSAKTFDYFPYTTLNDKSLILTGESLWHLSQPDESLFIGDKQKKLLKARVIKNIYSLKDEGMAVVGINEEYVRKKFLSFADQDTQMYITNKEGLILTASDSTAVGKDLQAVSTFKDFNKKKIDKLPSQVITKKLIISHRYSKLMNLEFIIVQSKENVLYELNQIQTITLIALIFCFILSSGICFLAASLLTRPLQKLNKSMMEVEKGDFSQSVEFTGKDEIGQLGQRYDQMVKQINTLIHDVYHSKLQQRNAELKSLQAQIRPHFLYNTLNTICWTARRKGQKDIADMTYALSKVFRLTLNDGKDFFSIKEELDLVRNYLFLQEMRFKPSFSYEIEVDEQIENLLIPKLLIQPFIENAVIHGIEPSKESGFIKISAFLKSNTITIEIMDNGVGIEQTQLNTLKTTMETNHSTGVNRQNGAGYAIHNVKERLRHVYGEHAKILIHSVKERGTRVEIHLPNIENMGVSKYDQIVNS